MAYFMFDTVTGELVEVSDDLIYDGSPPSGMTISYIDVPKSQLEIDYTWDLRIRDFVPKVV